MLVVGTFSKKLKAFILALNKVEQKDTDKAIEKFCSEMESEVFAAIKSADIIIPPGGIQVQTATGPGVNLQPIILKAVIK